MLRERLFRSLGFRNGMEFRHLPRFWVVGSEGFHRGFGHLNDFLAGVDGAGLTSLLCGGAGFLNVGGVFPRFDVRRNSWKQRGGSCLPYHTFGGAVLE